MSAPAPVMRPTWDEFQDFPAYVRKITPEIAPFGGCQIVPPPEWAHKPVGPAHEKLQRAEIKPIRQHVGGHNGRFQALMELKDPMPLQQFIADSALQSQPADGLSPEDLDSKFWRGLAARPSEYGADSSEAGSLFAPELSSWNLGALPGGVDNDLTQELPMAIPGLNRSMLYFGQWRSFFALHTEDCELQGASFLHYGAPKRWYVVPPSHAGRVRKVAADCFPELARECREFVRHKTTMLSPAVLKASNIPVRRRAL